MTIHKSTRLTPVQRQEIARRYFQGRTRVATLAREYHVSRNTIYFVIRRAHAKDFTIHTSINRRYRCLEYGIKRLAKIEVALEKRLKQAAPRYHKNYPGEMMHSDNTELPMLMGETQADKPETLFAAIDDFSRELYAAILPDSTQFSAARHSSHKSSQSAHTRSRRGTLIIERNTVGIPKSTHSCSSVLHTGSTNHSLNRTHHGRMERQNGSLRHSKTSGFGRPISSPVSIGNKNSLDS